MINLLLVSPNIFFISCAVKEICFSNAKLRDSPNILKFYGLSHLDNQMVMVVEWAELGSLREVYNTYDIAWPSKVKYLIIF